jgi:hypothetical protein
MTALIHVASYACSLLLSCRDDFIFCKEHIMDKRVDFWKNTFAKLGLGPRKTRGRARESYHRPVRLEQLEDRRLLSITVDSLADVINANDGVTTLREAIIEANATATDEITFAASLNLDMTPGEIELTEGELVIDSDVTITGPGVSQLDINADEDDDGVGESRVFSITAGISAILKGLAITRGNSTSGGGIWNAGNLALDQVAIANCQATGDGGGIYNAGTLTLNNSTVSGNSAGVGGGIYSTADGILTLNNSTVSGNTATNGNGGGIYNATNGTSDGVLTLSNTTISANTASGDGGGIANTGDLTLNNSTISGNSASDDGGGIYNAGQLEATSTTVADNSDGLFATTSATSQLGNTIVAGNVADADVNGTFTSLGHNLIGNGSGGSGFTAAGDQVGTSSAAIDAELGPLQDNGGPTWTHQLLTGSPAIDAGDNDGVPAIDQRGAPRILDGDLSDQLAATIDIGAFEFGAFFVNYAPEPSDPVRPADAVDGTSAGDGRVDVDSSAAFDQVSLRGAVQELNALPGEGYILFSPNVGTVHLTRQGAGEDSAAIGDLDVTGKLTIHGTGAATTVIDGYWINDDETTYDLADRIFHINPYGQGAQLRLEALTVQGGHSISDSSVDSGRGGAVLNNGGTLQVVDAVLGIELGSGVSRDEGYDPSNQADESGGVIYTRVGTVTIANSHTRGSDALNTDSTVNIITKGGGIYIESGGVTISSGSQISNNRADEGGGVYLQSGSLTIEGRSEILSNLGPVRGGGIYVEAGTLEIRESSTVRDNRTSSSIESPGDATKFEPEKYAEGGGIFVAGGTATILGESIISKNVAMFGAGIYNAATLVIEDGVLVEENSAVEVDSNPRSRGGGVFNMGELTITDSDIVGNYAWSTVGSFQSTDLSDGTEAAIDAEVDTLHGGGIYNAPSGSVTMSGGSISANAVLSGCGGGIANNHGDVTLIGGDVASQNRAVGADVKGAGIFNGGMDARLLIIDSKISDNTAYETGGGVYNRYGAVTIQNSTFSQNEAIAVDQGMEPSAGAIDHVSLLDFDCGFGLATVVAPDTLAVGTLAPIINLNNGLHGPLTVPFDIVVDDEQMTVWDYVPATPTEPHKLKVVRARNGTQLASHSGATVYGVGGSLTIANSTFSGNTCDWSSFETPMAGAIVSRIEWAVRATVIESCTFRNNDKDSTLAENIGQIYSEVQGSHPVSSSLNPYMFIQNTVIAAPNEQPWPDVVSSVGGITSGGNNLVRIGSTGQFAASGDQVGSQSNPREPYLGPLQDNGGPTETHMPDATSLLREAGSGTGFTGTTTSIAKDPLDPNYVELGANYSDKTLWVADASKIPTALPVRALIGSEVIRITDFDSIANEFTIERGVDRTEPLAHDVGVSLVIGDANATHGYHGLDLVLNVDITTTTQTDLTVVGLQDALPPTPFVIMVDEEQMLVNDVARVDPQPTGLPLGTFALTLSVSRGLGASATPHTADSTVLILADQTGSPRFRDDMDIGSVELWAKLAIVATSADKLEGHAGSTPFTFTVTRSVDTSGPTTVNWALTGSEANPATADDFVGGLPSGILSFAATETSQTFTVNVAGEYDFEDDEGFTITLSGPSGDAVIVTATAEGTIRNDDADLTTGLVVSTLDDVEDTDYSPSNLSLREALMLANMLVGRDQISFDPSVIGGTIILNGTELLIDSDVDVGDVGVGVTIDAGGSSRIFRVAGDSSSPVDVMLAGLTLIDGSFMSGAGGAIYASDATLDLSGVEISNSHAAHGGAIFAGARSTVSLDLGTYLHDNSATTYGGALYLDGSLSEVELRDAVIELNDAGGAGGGAVAVNGATLSLESTSSITGNTAPEFANVYVSSSSTLIADPWVVSTALDVVNDDYSDTDLSLRESLALATTFSGTDLINFDPLLDGVPIQLNGTELLIDSSVEIDTNGLGVTIDAGGNSRIFRVKGNVYYPIDVTLAGLTLTGGSFLSWAGGAIYASDATLDLDDVEITNSHANYGGAIFAGSRSTVNLDQGTYLHDNSASIFGGAVYLYGDTSNVVVSDAIVELNDAGIAGGGAAAKMGATISLASMPSVTGNTAPELANVYVSDSSTLIAVPWVVSTALDVVNDDYSDTDLSLRESLALATTFSGTDLINFDPLLDGVPIQLNGTELLIDSSVEIDTNGLDVTIDAGGSSRIFRVKGNVYYPIDVTLAGMTLTGGSFLSWAGGAIYASDATLDLNGVEITNSHANYGGAIFAGSRSTVNLDQGTYLHGNTATTYGGAVYLYGSTSTVNVLDATIELNEAGTAGGGFGVKSGATLTLAVDAVLRDNDALLYDEYDDIYADAASTVIDNRD